MIMMFLIFLLPYLYNLFHLLLLLHLTFPPMISPEIFFSSNPSTPNSSPHTCHSSFNDFSSPPLPSSPPLNSISNDLITSEDQLGFLKLLVILKIILTNCHLKLFYSHHIGAIWFCITFFPLHTSVSFLISLLSKSQHLFKKLLETLIGVMLCTKNFLLLLMIIHGMLYHFPLGRSLLDENGSLKSSSNQMALLKDIKLGW